MVLTPIQLFYSYFAGKPVLVTRLKLDELLELSFTACVPVLHLVYIEDTKSFPYGH